DERYIEIRRGAESELTKKEETQLKLRRMYYKKMFDIESPALPLVREEVRSHASWMATQKEHSNIHREYAKTMAFVIGYYFSEGVPSWTYYYPYSFGPLISDIQNLKEHAMSVSFTPSSPLSPFELLFSIIHPSVAPACLPEPVAPLMQHE
ncbi:5'-3' exoribonuclease like protein, partial [Aduncisulcus paluster]